MTKDTYTRLMVTWYYVNVFVEKYKNFGDLWCDIKAFVRCVYNCYLHIKFIFLIV